VFGSLDPVACEQAAWDRVAPKLRTVWPELKPELLLDAAAHVGLGTREYEIVKL
jgi:uncharacterized Fe-S center protein